MSGIVSETQKREINSACKGWKECKEVRNKVGTCLKLEIRHNENYMSIMGHGENDSLLLQDKHHESFP